MSNIPFPEGKFKAIHADPPWSFQTYSEKGKDRSPEQHYDCMGIEDIYKLPVQDIADNNCILFLWVTFPLLKEGIKTLEEWGFTYKTNAFTWAKKNKSNLGFFLGCGYFTRSNPEICLLGTKGKVPVKSRSVRQLIISPLREHSRKPEEVYGRIEQLVEGPYIDLFSRSGREGWTSWGYEVNKFGEE